MNKKHIIVASLAIIILLIGLNILGKSKNPSQEQILSNSQTSSNTAPLPTATTAPVPADKIEVVHFHGTHQCWSCITVGEYALKTIKEKFPEEYASGKIVFKDTNGELKENQDMVIKYQARGSSLFVNAIRDDKDDIAEDVTVWRLVNNESQFITYFGNKINTLLGK